MTDLRPIRQRVDHRLGRPERPPLCDRVKCSFPPRWLSARGRSRRGRPAGAAARLGCARSWTRPPARAGWQRRGERQQERTSYEPRHGEAPASRHVVRKPGPTPGPAGGIQSQAHRDL